MANKHKNKTLFFSVTYIKHPTAVSLCAVPPLGWGEFELCAMLHAQC